MKGGSNMDHVMWIIALCFCVALNIDSLRKARNIIVPVFALVLCILAIVLNMISII